MECLRSGVDGRFARGRFACMSLMASAVPETIQISLTIDCGDRSVKIDSVKFVAYSIQWEFSAPRTAISAHAPGKICRV
jgi:hypothetical protein